MTSDIKPFFHFTFYSSVWKIIPNQSNDGLLVECKNHENWETELYYFDLITFQINQIQISQKLPLWSSVHFFFDDKIVIAIEPPDQKPGFGRLLLWDLGASKFLLDSNNNGEISKWKNKIIWNSSETETDILQIELPQQEAKCLIPDEYYKGEQEYEDIRRILELELSLEPEHFSYLEINENHLIIGIGQSELKLIYIENQKLQVLPFFSFEEKCISPKSFCKFGQYLIVNSEKDTLQFYELF